MIVALVALLAALALGCATLAALGMRGWVTLCSLRWCTRRRTLRGITT